MDLAQRIDAAIDAALVDRIVGCVVLARRDGEPVYARAAGFADREAGRPMTRDAIFRLASVTKPIVATAALRMIDVGLLGLDDPVTEFLPWFAPRSPDGTISPLSYFSNDFSPVPNSAPASRCVRPQRCRMARITTGTNTFSP